MKHRLHNRRRRSLYIFLIFLSINLPGQIPEWDWVRSLATNQDEFGNDAASDPLTGDVIVVGDFRNDFSFVVPSSGNPSTDLSGSYGGFDGFVLKFDMDGNILWGFKIGGVNQDHIEAVTLDPAGNIYITGYVSTGDINFAGTSSLTSDSVFNNSNVSDLFLAKYDPTGALLWFRHSDGNTDVEGLGIGASDSAVYVSGNHRGMTTFGTLDPLITTGDYDAFVVKYTYNGSETWYITASSDENDIAAEVYVDSGNIYFIGSFEGETLRIRDQSGSTVSTMDNDEDGNWDVFVSSFSKDGEHNWSRRISSEEDDFGYGITGYNDTLYLCGTFGDDALFPAYSGNPVIHNNGQDAYICSMSKLNGNTGWVQTYTGIGDNDQVANDITVDQRGIIYVTGNFESGINVPDSLINAAGGSQDIFVVSHKRNGAYKWIKTAGGIGADFGNGVTTNFGINIYIAGNYYITASFDTITTPTGNTRNIYLAKLSLPCINAVGGILSASDSVVCEGNPVTLELQDYFGYITWESSVPGSDNWIQMGIGPSAAAVISPDTSKEYRAFLTVPGCLPDSSNSVLVDVNEQSTAVMTGDTSICEGNTATLTIHLNGNRPWVIEYTDGTDIISIADMTSPVYNTVTPFVTTQYTLTRIIDINGCDGIVSGGALVRVDTVVPSNPANAGSICSSSVELQANSVTGSGFWSYVAGPGTLSFDPSDSVPDATVTASEYGIYQINWREINGACFDDAETTVDFREAPVAEAGSDTIIDFGQSVQLSGSGGEYPLWRPDYMISDTTVYDPVINPLVTIRYYLSVYNSNGCSDTDSLLVTVLPPDFADAGNDTAICSGESTVLQASGGVAYRWEPVEGLSDPDIPDPVASPFRTTDYTVTVFNEDGISDKDTVTVIINPLPFIDAGEDVFICLGESVDLAADGNGDFRWDNPRYLSDPTIPDPVANPDVTVTFTVTVTDLYGCSNYDLITINVLIPPVADAGPDQELMLVTRTSLEASLEAGEIGTWSVGNGFGIFEDPGSPTTSVSNLLIGDNLFYWHVSNGVCPDAADDVLIRVLEPLIPTVITPNGDNKNDFFFLERIEEYGPVEITIKNRWGAEVYYSESYNNDWNGNDHDGQSLPADTYFYIMKINDLIMKGYIVVIR